MFEPKNLGVTRYQIRAKTRLHSPIRLVHLSDLHASTEVPLDFIERAIDTALDLHPDLICVTGDFITDKILNPDLYADILAKLSDRAPTFATLGNHDGGEWARGAGGYAGTAELRKLLDRASIHCLYNATTHLAVRGTSISIAGLADASSGDMNKSRAFRSMREADPIKLCLSHNPDTKQELYDYPWDLMLSGHTHGGQLVVPFVGGTPFAPVNDHRYVWGLKRWRDRLIHVTSGVGNVAGLRFNCPPEVAVLDFV